MRFDSISVGELFDFNWKGVRETFIKIDNFTGMIISNTKNVSHLMRIPLYEDDIIQPPSVKFIISSREQYVQPITEVFNRVN